jgi:hypothetical protein
LVLVSKAFYEKGTAVILPQCDGPFRITRLPSLHTAVLADVFTGEPYMHNTPISVARLVLFKFPSDWAEPEPNEVGSSHDSFMSCRVGEFVCVAPRTSQFSRVHVARVEKMFRDQEQIEVALYWVPPECRTGPWQRRQWKLWDEGGIVRREVISANEFVCKVFLQEGALTQGSLEVLTANGVPATTQPRRDSTLPPRR